MGGHRIIGGLIPANVIPDEILTDHPDRLRAMIIESSNPAHSLADSERIREALAALDRLVVIDVAMTETAKLTDWVLPASCGLCVASRDPGVTQEQLLRLAPQNGPLARPSALASSASDHRPRPCVTS